MRERALEVRRARFEVRLTMQTSCPSKFAWMEGVVCDGTGALSGDVGLLDALARELGSIEEIREATAANEIDVHLTRAVVHPVDSRPRDFAAALLAVARALRGVDQPVPYVRRLVIERLDVS